MKGTLRQQAPGGSWYHMIEDIHSRVRDLSALASLVSVVQASFAFARRAHTHTVRQRNPQDDDICNIKKYSSYDTSIIHIICIISYLTPTSILLVYTWSSTYDTSNYLWSSDILRTSKYDIISQTFFFLPSQARVRLFDGLRSVLAGWLVGHRGFY